MTRSIIYKEEHKTRLSKLLLKQSNRQKQKKLRKRNKLLKKRKRLKRKKR